jgi:hypothetical protein
MYVPLILITYQNLLDVANLHLLRSVKDNSICQSRETFAPEHLDCYRAIYLQTKTRREYNVKRMLCIGGSVAAILILILLMTTTAPQATSPAKFEESSVQTPGALTVFAFYQFTPQPSFPIHDHPPETLASNLAHLHATSEYACQLP